MRRKIMQFAVAIAMLAQMLMISAASVDSNPTIRVGLFYGGTVLPSANLENSVNSGYRFGYFSDSLEFVPLGYTEEKQITMLKTQNLYFQSGTYYDTAPSGSYTVIGCYHIQLPGSYGSFEAAKAAADAVSGGFVAWTGGAYYVRSGAYGSRDGAVSAQASLGVSDTSIVGTSSFGVTAVATKTAKILFQFDGGDSRPFGVSPGLTDGLKAVTWFKGFRYYGGFRYQRLDGGDLTVVNILPLEDYVKGVVPYEMSNSWPLEALKAEAVCARTYATISLNKHRRYGFDLCNTTDCQVYRGLNQANEVTDRAADETRGMFARYGSAYAQTYYHSCDGGATENVNNVWDSTANLPYLSGVIDPYEALVASKISQYNWTVSYTKAELASLLQSKGYQCAAIVDFRVASFTPTGNVGTITFVDANGKEWSFSRDKVRTLLSLRSIRYQVSGGGKYYVNGGSSSISSVIGAYAISGSGQIAQVDGSSGPYVITSVGTEALASAGNTFTISGSGWGHNVGMSQWGAYAMAGEGYTYDQILKFYFTGIDIY